MINKAIFLFSIILSKLFIVNLFNIHPTNIFYGYHLLSIELLQKDLLKSIFYLHSQPPLWNFFMGIIAKIFNGNLEHINNFLFIYQILITSGIIYFSLLILELFTQKKIYYYILFIFLLINPTIIFFENITSYTHTTCLLFTMISYHYFKLFLSHDENYEIYIYINLLILSLIWAIFQPFIIIIIFIINRILLKNLPKKILLYAVLIFSLSLIPVIKNKIVFGTFIFGSSWQGNILSSTFMEKTEECPNHSQIATNSDTNNYSIKYNRTFHHPSVIGELSNENNIGVIYKSKICFQTTIKRIINNPLFWLKGRLYSFLSSHGKFGFDQLHPKPKGWDNYYIVLDNLYKNKNIKLGRQLIIFVYMMSLYIIFFYVIFFSREKKEIKKAYFSIFFIYFYLLIVSHFSSGHEHARMLYTGFVIHVLFLIRLLINNLSISQYKKKINI